MSLNLLKMARPGLLFELQNAIEEARKNGVESIRANVQVEENGGKSMVAMRVTPFRTPIQDKTSFLISFESADGDAAARIPGDSCLPSQR